jgi:hypothetical protein
MEFATLFWVGMGFGAIVLVLHFLTSVEVDHGPMRYERWRQAFLARYVMSRSAARAGQESAAENAPQSPLSPVKLNPESAETPQRVAENSTETFTLGETQALARLVAAGKIGLTDAVKIGADAKSGEKYQKRSREIKAAVEKMQDNFPNMSPEQKQARQALGIGKP